METYLNITITAEAQGKIENLLSKYWAEYDTDRNGYLTQDLARRILVNKAKEIKRIIKYSAKVKEEKDASDAESSSSSTGGR